MLIRFEAEVTRDGWTVRKPGTDSSWRGEATLLLLLVLAGTSPADDQVAVPIGVTSLARPSLEAAVIGDISIRRVDVFDSEDPEENAPLHRLINTLHIQTRDAVIRRQLLVHTGDVYSKPSIDEAERLLRENDYLRSAEIVPTRREDGQVDLEVRTEDAWSLTPSISFSRKGGQNFGGVEIEESNLFGTGSELKLGYKVDIARDEQYVAYRDRQLGNSWLELDFGVADNSDGFARNLALHQPFYALDTRRSFGVLFNQFDQLDPLYRLGEAENEVRHEALQYELFYGWSKGLREGRVTRWRAGLGYDEHRFEPEPGAPLPTGRPVDRRDIFPFVGVEWVEDRYETIRNADNMEVVEDRHLGARYSARIGYASTLLGSDDEAWLLAARTSRGFRLSPRDTLMLIGAFDSRLATRSDDQWRIAAGAKLYHRQSEKRVFVAELLADAGRRFDTDETPTIGGENGLRGYPISYQSGDSRFLLTLEQRVFSDWYPFRIFRIGAAAFFDAGRTWGGAADANLGLLRDAGVGLRISSPRSSTGRMLHVNLAWPLDGPPELRGAQLVIETRKSF